VGILSGGGEGMWKGKMECEGAEGEKWSGR
jgi:hypothetical protein